MSRTLTSILRRTMTTAARVTEGTHTQYAKDQFSISGGSGLYDRARPSYPADAVSKVLANLSSAPSATALELGAGTGIFSRLILARAKEFGVSRLISLEPSEGMRKGWQDALDKKPELKAVEHSIGDGLFQETGQADASADVVAVAQAWHWNYSEGPKALKEVARVLKPKGHLSLIWNLEDGDVPWIAQLREAYEKYESGTPQYRLGYWKNTLDCETAKTEFEPYTHDVFTQTLESTEQGVIDRVLSKSYITALSQQDQDNLVAEIKNIVQRGDGKVWIDEAKGTFEYKYKTDLYTFVKK